jgi:hypothetical protein
MTPLATPPASTARRVAPARPIARACGRDLSSSAVMNASPWRFGTRQKFLDFLSFAETVEINVLSHWRRPRRVAVFGGGRQRLDILDKARPACACPRAIFFRTSHAPLPHP